MQIELIKDKVFYQCFDKQHQDSTGVYSYYNKHDVNILSLIRQNIATIKLKNHFQELVILKQVHGTDIVDIDKLYNNSSRDNIFTNHRSPIIADASTTSLKGIALGIVTADCVPVLFASDDGKHIGAAHCGWRSAKQNIVNHLASLLRSKGAQNIRAIIGPSIQQKSYEVDTEYYKDFIANDSDNHDFFTKNSNDKYMFDLPGYVKRKILLANVELVSHIDDDTYSLPNKYPSYRRACHTGEKYLQNILSTVVIRS